MFYDIANEIVWCAATTLPAVDQAIVPTAVRNHPQVQPFRSESLDV